MIRQALQLQHSDLLFPGPAHMSQIFERGEYAISTDPDRLDLDTIHTYHPALQGLRRFSLANRDAHRIYRQFGFRELSKPESKMEILRPDVYRNPAPQQRFLKSGITLRRTLPSTLNSVTPGMELEVAVSFAPFRSAKGAGLDVTRSQLQTVTSGLQCRLSGINAPISPQDPSGTDKRAPSS
jgi:hypothetical protein